MANELRMYSFALNFDGSQGITGVKNFTKALIDAKGAEDALNASLGEGVTATISNVSSKEDMVRQARLLVDQLNRTEKQVQQLTAQYQLQAQMVGKDCDEIEKLNANPDVHGILLQHPVPEQIVERACFDAISLAKDVDGVTCLGFGRMAIKMLEHQENSYQSLFLSDCE